jgi:hypothetical protein
MLSRSSIEQNDVSRIRRAGAVALACAALGVWFGMAPPEPASADVSAIEAAQSLADLNNASASGAPQQTVVNGWHAIDLLEIVAQNSMRVEPVDHRGDALLMLGVLGLSFGLATTPVHDGGARRGAPGSTQVDQRDSHARITEAAPTGDVVPAFSPGRPGF